RHASKHQKKKTPRVRFFFFDASQDGLLPSEDKLQAIKDIQAPPNTKELQTLLGMVTYLKRFSAKLAKIVAPLRELIKKNVHFRWEPHHQQALDDIKKELCTKQLISCYDSDPNTVTLLQCDVRTLALGAWIRQIDQHGQEIIVGMALRCLSPTESRDSNTERECLAVMFGLEKFEYYLLGRQEVAQNVIYQTLENSWGVGEAEGHDEIFVMPEGGIKGRFPFVPLPDSNKVVRVTEV
uniref:Reverse transcriptase/retrotransposon-derived protein RNase H-like domain-containing protein n=1 Tax=Oryzias latipes TaxID=8090 RepID=A0A3P9M953_ORYLA